jgi:hypothetical protein
VGTKKAVPKLEGMCFMAGLTVAAAAMQALNNALGVARAAKERSKGSNDLELKEIVSKLYDVVLDSKEGLLRLAEENDELHRKIKHLENAQKEKPELKQIGDGNFYFVGEKGPYCQACYDGKLNKLVALSPAEDWNRGVRRECPVCHEYFYEKRMDTSPIRVGGRRG